METELNRIKIECTSCKIIMRKPGSVPFPLRTKNKKQKEKQIGRRPVRVREMSRFLLSLRMLRHTHSLSLKLSGEGLTD